jgi:hypothetical protein
MLHRDVELSLAHKAHPLTHARRQPRFRNFIPIASRNLILDVIDARFPNSG